MEQGSLGRGTAKKTVGEENSPLGGVWEGVVVRQHRQGCLRYYSSVDMYTRLLNRCSVVRVQLS